jgi:hypothetical protein
MPATGTRGGFSSKRKKERTWSNHRRGSAYRQKTSQSRSTHVSCPECAAAAHGAECRALPRSDVASARRPHAQRPAVLAGSRQPEAAIFARPRGLKRHSGGPMDGCRAGSRSRSRNLLPLWRPSRLVQDEAVEDVVGRNREALLYVASSACGRPSSPSPQTRSRSTDRRSAQSRNVCATLAAAPRSRPPPPPRQTPSAQPLPPRGAAPDPRLAIWLRRRLLHQPQRNGDHAHARHRHRCDRPTHRRVRNLVHVNRPLEPGIDAVGGRPTPLWGRSAAWCEGA